MADFGPRIGREIAVTFDGTVIDGREFGATFDGAPIDITDSSSAGWQELLERVGGDDSSVRKVDLSFSFVAKSDFFKRRWFNLEGTGKWGDVVYTYPDGGTLTGRFRMSSFTEGDPYDDASTGDVTLSSSGEVTYTPAAA